MPSHPVEYGKLLPEMDTCLFGKSRAIYTKGNIPEGQSRRAAR